MVIDELLLNLGSDSHPHPSTWEFFIAAIAPTIKHLCFESTHVPYKVPLFALKMLCAQAPNLQLVKGLPDAVKIEDGADLSKVDDEMLKFVIRLEVPLRDWKNPERFENLQKLLINLKDAKDLPEELELDLEPLKKLRELSIGFDEEEGEESDATPPPKTVLKLKFSEENNLTKLSIMSFWLHEETWQKLGESLKNLQEFYYKPPVS